MGFYIRKSVSLGGVRLNLSKSGLGVSTGVKGFRVGMNGRGTYVHMGRGGLYYRQQLSWNRHRSQSRSSKRPQAAPAAMDSGVFYTESLAQPLDISSGLADVDHVLEHFRNRPNSNWISWCLGVGAAVAMLWSAIAATILAVACGASVILLHATKSQRILIYNLDDDAELRFSRFVETLEEYFTSSKLWLYEEMSGTFDWKRNAGATALIKRRPALVHTEGEKTVRSNISIPTLVSAQDRIHFLPDMAVCANGESLSGFAYNDIGFVDELTRFIESEGAPNDAQIVDQTWQFTNKNGGPDRRFNNNRVLPVCLYQQTAFSFGSKYSRTITKSRVSDSQKLRNALSDLQAIHLTVSVVPPAPSPVKQASVPENQSAPKTSQPPPTDLPEPRALVPVITQTTGLPAMTAPFGIEFHSNISDLMIINNLPNRMYAVTPPAPHPLFPTYIVQTNAADEVVWIKGVGEVVENDAYGIAIRGVVDRVAEQLPNDTGADKKQIP